MARTRGSKRYIAKQAPLPTRQHVCVKTRAERTGGGVMTLTVNDCNCRDVFCPISKISSVDSCYRETMRIYVLIIYLKYMSMLKKNVDSICFFSYLACYMLMLTCATGFRDSLVSLEIQCSACNSSPP